MKLNAFNWVEKDLLGVKHPSAEAAAANMCPIFFWIDEQLILTVFVLMKSKCNYLSIRAI